MRALAASTSPLAHAELVMAQVIELHGVHGAQHHHAHGEQEPLVGAAAQAEGVMMAVSGPAAGR